ncbi:hypothetical protein RLOatenuis_1620 [Rickettsiales bacterium]|nr:hypothetical protein RLOatenuis_1620 [Rickettsiales bacterium]
MHSQSPQETLQWKDLFAVTNPSNVTRGLFEEEVQIIYQQDPKDDNENIILKKEHGAFTYEEIEGIIQRLRLKNRLIDTTLAMDVLQQAKTKLPVKNSIFITESNPIFALSIKNNSLILKPISIEFSNIKDKIYMDFIEKFKCNLQKYKNAMLLIENGQIINVSGLRNSKEMSDIIIKQFAEYGLDKKSEQSYICGFIDILSIKDLASKEINTLQSLIDLPDHHIIAKHREAAKASYSIFLRLSKSGTINALNEIQMRHLREATQLKGIFKHAPPAITRSFDKLLTKVPEKLAHLIRTGREQELPE